MTDILKRTYKGIVAWWQDLGIATREDLSEALVEYRIHFAYHTGAIENPALTYHDNRDVFEDGCVRSFSGDPRTLFEIQNLKTCHEVILDSFASKRQLDEELLLETRQTLTQGTYDERRWRLGERPGPYRVRDHVVGAGDVGFRARSQSSVRLPQGGDSAHMEEGVVRRLWCDGTRFKKRNDRLE